MNKAEDLQSAIEYLRRASTVRVRCGHILRLGRQQQLNHFRVNDDALDSAAQLVAEVTKAEYPELNVPYHSRWRHFDVGGIDRTSAMRNLADSNERGRCLTELAVTSVLLDAGAGDQWCYFDEKVGKSFGRSEGLAVASFYMYNGGAFSSDERQPWIVDSQTLCRIKDKILADGFQHGVNNPLVGLTGRVTLLQSLGASLAKKPKYFGEHGRLGHFFDYLLTLADGAAISAPTVLTAVLQAFGDIWPGRIILGGTNMGDVWRHALLRTDDHTSELVPFHKLSQWLTYSLLEPLEQAGVTVTDVGGLTGLPEYRNGGLLVDTGVLQAVDPEILSKSHRPGDEVIVEWRALTVALLDELGLRVRQLLQKNEAEFPLAKVLQGGTWAAGRKIAAQKRSGGPPPIRIISDGTVF